MFPSFDGKIALAKASGVEVSVETSLEDASTHANGVKWLHLADRIA